MRFSPRLQKGHPFDKDPQIVERLAELEDLRHNWSDKDDGPEKDEAARKALSFAASIFAHIAAWALDHRLGLAGQDRRPTDTPGLPDPYSYLGVARHGTLTPLQGRRFVRDLLMTIGDDLLVPGVFVQALEALDHGQILPPMETATGSRLGLQELQARLAALCYIEYQFGKGIKKSVTAIEVADLFAVNPESMKDWRADLTRRLGQVLVDTRLGQARADGEQYRKHSGPGELDWTVRDVCEDAHGLDVLQRAAESYKGRGQR